MKTVTKIIGIIVGVVALVVMLRLAYPYIVSSGAEEEELDGYEKMVQYLKREENSEIILYGEEIGFRESVEYRKISTIDETNIKSDKDYVYLIINDLNGTISFTEENLKFLKNYADKNLSFNFLYIGNDKMDLFTSGIFDSYAISDESKSFGYMLIGGDRLVTGGTWETTYEQYMEKNKEVLQENILYELVDAIKSNEEAR